MKLKLEDRWKYRSTPKRRVAPAPAPAPASAPAVNETLTPIDLARIARWVAAKIIPYPPDRCLHCRRPIIVGQKWLELVNDNSRARFHADCIPAWRAEQEIAARGVLGLPPISTKETTP